MKKWEFQQQIIGAWELIESVEPDISTEQLISRLCDCFKTDASTVCEAISTRKESK